MLRRLAVLRPMLLRPFIMLLGALASIGSPIVSAILMLLIAGLLSCAGKTQRELIAQALCPSFACGKLLLIGLRSSVFEP